MSPTQKHNPLSPPFLRGINWSPAQSSTIEPTVREENPQFIYGFTIASYNRNYPLIIDPGLDYSTFLGGGGNEGGSGIAVDGLWNAYVTGWTFSTDFPTTPGAFDTSNNSNWDAFVTKLNATGTDLEYSTFLGGGGGDGGNGIAVDGSWNAYVTGWTTGGGFPTTAGAFDTGNSSGAAFVCKFQLKDPEICDDGMDNDNDGLVDCDDPECCGNAACFGNPKCNILSETLLSRQAVMSNVEVSAPDFGGTSTLNFTDLEFVKITTGSFAEKGFSKGACEATLEGAAYTGEWSGVTFLKPQERKIYLKGAVTGQINAAVEGYLTESVPNSGNYDKYQATWKIGRLGGADASATINVNGTISYQDTEYPNTELYLLQTNTETTPSGDYDPDPLNVVLTHLRVVREDSPYVGEGFSIISYNSQSGAGLGWTYDRLLSPGVVEMKGLFSSPLYGVATATLDDSSIPRTLSLNIKRIDLGKPPAPDLKVKVWGPTRVSPGQTVDYMVEYRNDGVKAATEAVVYFYPDMLLDFVSASSGYYYDPYSHQVNWNLGSLTPRTSGYLNVKLRVPWGLPAGVELDNRSYILDLALGLDTALRSHERNIIGNGINFNRENQDEVSFYNAVANQNHAEWVPLYDQTNPFTGALQTYLAEHDVFVGEGVNGNGVGNNSPITGPFNRGYFDSGGASALLINK